MTILASLKNLAKTAFDQIFVDEVFTPKTLPTSFRNWPPSEDRPFEPGHTTWWRRHYLTPEMQHRLANDKSLMLAENPLLRGLIARHFKAN